MSNSYDKPIFMDSASNVTDGGQSYPSYLNDDDRLSGGVLSKILIVILALVAGG